MKSNYELAEVIRRFGKKLIDDHNITPLQMKVLRKIEQCRTATLGGHEEQCDCCEKKDIAITVVEIGIALNVCRQNKLFG